LYKSALEKVQKEASGINAKNIVTHITRFHRVQASPGFRQAAEYCERWFRENGLASVEILEFPGDGKQIYWGYRMPQAWSIKDAELRVVSPKGAQGLLCSFRDLPMSVIQRSVPTPPEGVEAELAVLEDGTEEIDYRGKDVKGKIVLTSGEIQQVKELAVDKYGALGIITDRMAEFPPIRHRMDVGGALCYTSFWWRGGEKRCFGFVLSPKEGEKLRKAVKEIERKMRLREKLEQDEEKGVRVHAKVDSEFYDGTCEDVTAVIPGRELEEDVLVVAHLCHPLPSANDNASGCAAAMEMARCLNQLISRGELPQPRRSIRFLLVPEMMGTYAYLSTREEKIPRLVAGVNLDMVGEDQDITKSPLLVEMTPDASPSYVNYVMASVLRDLATDGESLSGTAKYALFKWAITPYSGGSDHYILSDPTVGVPTPMIIHWPDLYYHTSQDTLDKVSAEELKRVVTMAATYSYFLANAGYEECLWIANEVTAEAKRRLIGTVQTHLSSLLEKNEKDEKEARKEPEERIADVRSELEERLTYVLDREIDALRSIERITPEKDAQGFRVHLNDLEAEISELAQKELDRFRVTMERCRLFWVLKKAPATRKPRLTATEKKAARVIPRRIYRGPISMRLVLERMSDEQRRTYRKEMERKKKFRNILDPAIYWSDGKRNLLEIAKLVRQEVGQIDLKFLLGYFGTLEKYGLIKIERTS